MDENRQWGPDTLLLNSMLDLDALPVPNRNPDFGETDTYMWDADEMSSSYGMVKWTSKDKPTQNGCARLLATHGTGDHHAFEASDRFCAMSNQRRIALIVVKQRTQNGWEMEVTVWKYRLP